MSVITVNFECALCGTVVKDTTWADINSKLGWSFGPLTPFVRRTRIMNEVLMCQNCYRLSLLTDRNQEAIEQAAIAIAHGMLASGRYSVDDVVLLAADRARKLIEATQGP